MGKNEKTFSEDENTNKDKTMTILQLGSASMHRLNVKVNFKDIVAVIDTGAEVTIISNKVYEMLQNKPTIKKHTVMHCAGRDMKMKTFIIEPIDIGIGTRTCSSEVYRTLMDDDIRE